LGLSPEARLLLLECSQDPGGTVMCVRSFQGLTVSTNNKGFSQAGDRRSEAKWKAAVEELVRLGLLEPVGSAGEMFEITDAGYGAADRLRGEGGATLPG